VNDPLPDLRSLNQDVPEALVRVVEKALAKDKNQRFQSATEFARALRSIDLNAPKTSSATMVEPTPAIYSTMVEDQPAGGTYQQTMVESSSPNRTQQQTSGYTPPPPSDYAGSYSGSMGGRKKKGIGLPLIIGGGIVGLIILAAILFIGSRLLGLSGSEVANLELTTEAANFGAALSTLNNGTIPTDTEAPGIVVDATEPVVVPTDTLAPTDTLEPTIPPTATVPSEPYVRINSIGLDGNTYIVEYETFGYTEVLPGEHVHFFFNTTSPQDAGAGGAGPWYVWGGPRPFNKYTTGDRPGGATQMCALYAYPNHTIALNTGNCVDLP